MKSKACAIMADNEGRLLLQLRDDDPEKGTWVPFGGGVEHGETEEQALRREIKEELDLTVGAVSFLGNYEDAGIKQAVYTVVDPVDPEGLTLHEGAAMKFFTASELQTLAIGFNFKNVIDDYYKKHGKPKS
jgi:8-oxo-dGTP pyrophosphatase MutT (NUDIX family)